MVIPQGRFDLAVVGAGILGLATAWAAARQGLRVVLVDRDARANGASVRNFGFVSVSGQCRASMWERARRTREVWSEVSAAAGIPIVQTGLWVTARRPESVAVLWVRCDRRGSAGEARPPGRLIRPGPVVAQCLYAYSNGYAAARLYSGRFGCPQWENLGGGHQNHAYRCARIPRWRYDRGRDPRRFSKPDSGAYSRRAGICR